jgi:hypothetical protein
LPRGSGVSHHRHVGDRGESLVDLDRDVERRAKGRLVPRREHLARVYRLEMRREHSLVGEASVLAHLVRHLEKTLRMLADRPAVIDLQPMPPCLDQTRRGRERYGFLDGVDARRQLRLHICAGEDHRSERKVRGIQRQRLDRFRHVDLDLEPALESILREVGHESQRVMSRNCFLGQLAGRRVERKARLGESCSRREKRKHDQAVTKSPFEHSFSLK